MKVEVKCCQTNNYYNYQISYVEKNINCRIYNYTNTNRKCSLIIVVSIKFHIYKKRKENREFLICKNFQYIVWPTNLNIYKIENV